VIGDRSEAAGLAWASRAGLPVRVVRPGDHPDRASFDRALAAAIDEFRPGLIVLAGFMRILGTDFVTRYLGRILNIHPSLLPRHRGLHTHRRALESGDRVHGASVHFVTPELDGGPVAIQARVRVRDDDDEASLAARVLQQEHRIYPECIDWYASGRLKLRDGQAVLDGRVLESPVIREESSEAAA
jgi:phosphoribosylglycinamide formyltransferase-1